MRARGVSARSSVLALAAGLLAACASLENTPIQAYIWELGHACEHVDSSCHVDRVDSQGRDGLKELTRGAQTPVNPSPQSVPDFPIAVTPAPGERGW